MTGLRREDLRMLFWFVAIGVLVKPIAALTETRRFTHNCEDDDERDRL
jgi:hypothetical protein